MNIDIAQRNLDFLKGLSLCKVEKLYVNEENLISFDDRMFKSIRRYYDGSSRNDLIDPIQATFSCLLSSDNSVETLCVYDTTIHTIEVYLKHLYTEQQYNQLFKSVIRQVKLGILDAKTHIKDITAIKTLSDTVAEPDTAPVIPAGGEPVKKECTRRKRRRN